MIRIITLICIAYTAVELVESARYCLSIDELFWIYLYLFGGELFCDLVQGLGHLTHVGTSLELRLFQLLGSFSDALYSRRHASKLLMLIDLVLQLQEVRVQRVQRLLGLPRLQL